MVRMSQRKIKTISDKQEKRTAADFGAGRTRPGSGNKDHSKGDVITGRRSTGTNENDFLVENKFTFNSKFGLKMDTWNKIANEALRENMRTPAMQIDIAKDTIAEAQLVVMNRKDFVAWGFESKFTSPDWKRKVLAKSVMLHAEFFLERFSTTNNYRHSLYFSTYGIWLEIISLKDFKDFMESREER